MARRRQAWERELASALEAHRPSLRWLSDHLAQLVDPEPQIGHLISMASDLCDAGHVHLDIVLWVLGRRRLHAVLVSEEHYDRGPEDVETTFETTVSTHPLDTVVGVQVATASHPDGHPMDISLAVMLNTPGSAGHVDPVVYDDPDVVSYALSLQPSPLSFTVPAERTPQVTAFARELLQARDALVQGP